MKNINLIKTEILEESSKYKPVGLGVFRDLTDERGFATYRMAISYELEPGENTQYPLEDILDKFFLHVEAFLTEINSEGPIRLVLGGEMVDLQKFSEVFGKRAYNQEYQDENGQTRVKLVIE